MNLSPAVEYLESDEHIETMRLGRLNQTGVEVIDRFGHPQAATIMGTQDTYRRPMFEVLEDHDKNCLWPDCAEARMLRNKRRHRRNTRRRRHAVWQRYTVSVTTEEFTLTNEQMQSLASIIDPTLSGPAIPRGSSE